VRERRTVSCHERRKGKSMSEGKKEERETHHLLPDLVTARLGEAVKQEAREPVRVGRRVTEVVRAGGEEVEAGCERRRATGSVTAKGENTESNARSGSTCSMRAMRSLHDSIALSNLTLPP
jgi:hypothetical protein